jgi:PTH2 family peptidyl-tRNA hydrolase
MRETKQVIVIRKDLKMRKGKAIAQGAHASIAFLSRRLETRLMDAERQWIESGFTKICLYVNSEQELLEVDARARVAGLECHLVTDSGLTEFKGVPTRTCLAIGPDYAEKIDPVTGGLPLY